MISSANGFVANSLFLYPRGLIFDSRCVPCRMSLPHLQCYPTLSPDTTGSAILKSMSDKLQQQNANSPWTFQPGFRGSVAEHPFSYDEQNRTMDSSHHEFDNDASRQPAAPFMQHFLPRIGLPFADFTDYQRFNGFQRNAFLTSSFGTHLPNTSFTHPFPLNTVPGQMPMMDGFNFAQHPHSLMQHSLQPVSCPNKPKSEDTTEDLSDKPPVLSAEYPIKQEEEIKFDTVVPKEEPLDDAAAREVLSKKKEAHPFSLSQQLATSKPFDSARVRDDIIAFNHPFYHTPIDTNSSFKREMSTPPLVDARSDFEKYNANAKRPEFQQPPLHDCQVCLSTHANGLHFGARTCAACAAFFRRTISDDKRYVCKRNQRCTNASRDGTGYRKICRSCRMKRCLEIGMLPENVQHKRSRRDSVTPPPATRKSTFDTFFNGFYPPFPAAGSQMPSSSQNPIPPTDPRHPPAN